MDTRRLSAVWRWCREHPYSLIAAVFFAAYLIPFCTRKKSEWEDVYVRSAAELVAGVDFYLQPQGYFYPPFMTLMALPFTEMPLWVGRVTWYAVNVLCFVLLVRLAWRLSGGGRLEGAAVRDRSEQWVFLLGLGCGVWYSFHTMTHKQTDLVIAALLLGGCVAVWRGRPLLGGGLLGLSAAMKCTPLLFAPYLMLRRRWLAAGVLVAVAVGVNLLPDLVHPGPEGGTWLGRWVTIFLAPMTGANHAPGIWGSSVLYNQSLGGFWNRLLTTEWLWADWGVAILPRPDAAGPQTLKALTYGTGALLLIAIFSLFALRRGREERETRAAPPADAVEMGAVFCLMLLLSPMSSIPHFCTLILPGFCLARRAVYRGGAVVWSLLALAILAALTSNKDLWGGRIYT
ncbi:MAG TPA: glycosyltransferase family 87 protein, partial [Gemmataceae bacterium]